MSARFGDQRWISCGCESNETRNARSPLRITFVKNCEAAFCASDIRGCIDAEVSMARPMESGRLFTCSNFATFTGLPSSMTVNASWADR